MSRIFHKVSRDLLPQIRDRYPMLYLEHGRLEVDDSSVKWIGADRSVIPLPVAALAGIMLGPGTSVTHEAIKAMSESNCLLSWVGTDSMLYYAAGFTPTADTANLLKQIDLSSDPQKRTEVARAMYQRRFPECDLSGRSIQEMMGMEGGRVRALYRRKAEEYGVEWGGRDYIPGQADKSNTPNRILTSCNAALYGLLLAVTHSLGFSPRIGFVHHGCPLPFIYDLADLYKSEISIELAFALTAKLGGTYDTQAVMEGFVEKVCSLGILARAVDDICTLMEVKHGGAGGK